MCSTFIKIHGARLKFNAYSYLREHDLVCIKRYKIPGKMSKFMTGIGKVRILEKHVGGVLFLSLLLFFLHVF